MSSLYKNFSAFLAQHQLIPKNSTVIAGVSGGVDSMVMLDCLLKYKKKNEISLVVAHLNHQIRGAESDIDESMVQNFCHKNRCEFRSKSVDVPKIAFQKGISLEMAGREARYQFFEELSQTVPDSIIATAHNADDQAETILYRILKGTGINGLQGIRPKRDNVIRPLLFAKKTDIYAYAKENQVPYREDHTNTDTSIVRNYLRQSLIPAIKSEINPSFEQSLIHLSEIISDVNQLNNDAALQVINNIIVQHSSTEIVLDIHRLKKCLGSVIYEIIRISVSTLDKSSADIDYTTFENIYKLINTSQTGKRLRISDLITAFRNRNELIFQKNKNTYWSNTDIAIGQKYEFPEFSFEIELAIESINPKHMDQSIEYIDADKLRKDTPLVLRHWQQGDRIAPLGSDFSKKVSDIFIDHKVSLQKKKQLPVLCSGNSIIWICGIQLSDLYKVDNSTQQILKLSYKEKYND